MLLLIKKQKLIIILFSLLLIHLVSWASESNAELKIINKTKKYYVQATNIKVYYSEGGYEIAQSNRIPPGGQQDMKWDGGRWLSWKSSTDLKKRGYSTLMLTISTVVGHGAFVNIGLNQTEAQIEDIKIKIEPRPTPCYKSERRYETIEYCDYTITVGP